MHIYLRILFLSTIGRIQSLDSKSVPLALLLTRSYLSEIRLRLSG
jgi:hypothetical protein